MKKIMFADRFALTQAVLNGTKTQTRRLVSLTLHRRIGNELVEIEPNNILLDNERGWAFELDGKTYPLPKGNHPNYQVGEIVAVAQDYNTIGKPQRDECNREVAGNTNKMFVKPEMMPHQIRITDIRFEWLQDITDEDCLKEGIKVVETPSSRAYSFGCRPEMFATPREAYAHLIDKIGGRGMWESNPYVFVYDFELVK